MLDFENLPDENTKRFIAILNKKIDTGRLFNALGHMTAGLVNQIDDIDDLCFLKYTDMDGGEHPSISHYPFIILKADNSNQIRKVRDNLISLEIPFTDFVSTMILGTSEEQIRVTAQTPEDDLDYFGICMFGNTAELKSFTSKFSLFK